MIDGIGDITFISAGFKQILESEGVRDLVQELADGICDRANANYGGDGFGVSVKHLNYGGGRVGAFIYAKDADAAKAQSEDQVLTRAINS